MARVLVTGMSGTGKTTLLHELRRRGHLTVDTDCDGWSLPIERVTKRTNNPYGNDPEQQAEIGGYVETVEPLLRRGASLELDARLADAATD